MDRLENVKTIEELIDKVMWGYVFNRGYGLVEAEQKTREFIYQDMKFYKDRTKEYDREERQILKEMNE